MKTKHTWYYYEDQIHRIALLSVSVSSVFMVGQKTDCF